MESLFSITMGMKEVLISIDENFGEVTPEIEVMLHISEQNMITKSSDYVAVIKNFDGVNNTIDGEIKRLQAIKKRNKGIITNLKDRLLDALNVFGKDRIKLELHTIGTRKSESVEISENFDIEKADADLVIVSKSLISKTELKKMLKDGRKIDGISLVQNKNLSIK